MSCTRAAAAALVLLIAPALAGAAPIEAFVEYRIADHPDGNAANPTYWLRADDIAGPPTTFTTLHPDADVRLLWDSDLETIHIWGTTFGGHAAGDVYDDEAGLWSIDFRIQNVRDEGAELRVFGLNGSGTITSLRTEEEFALELYPPTYDSFIMGRDHRGFDGVSGWGWIAVDGARDRTNDFLFTVAQPVPEPGSATLFGVGGILVGALVRRRI